MFDPLTTERLLLRQPRLSDAEALFAYRNDPDVAEYQDWPLPFLRERAAVVVGEASTLPELGTGEWMMLTIANKGDDEVHGDVFVEFVSEGRIGEIGYSLARDKWGNGFAVEAVSAVVNWLFESRNVRRVAAMINPKNLRSARVVEQCGFVFEGHLHNSLWSRDQMVDDWVYGLTPELHREWLDRPQGRPERIELVEPYPTGLRRVVELGVHQSQDHLVSPIAASLAQVAVPPLEEGFEDDPDGPRVVPWPRIVHADGEPVGFVMMEQPTKNNPEPYLWRLLIDRLHQRRGIGGEVLSMVIEQAREWGSESLLVSWMPGVGSPEGMYLAKGFVPTGNIIDGETEARLVL